MAKSLSQTIKYEEEAYFSYFKVIRVLFPGCIVLLDDVHVDRYFRDKVFPGILNSFEAFFYLSI